jgi:hypothetical protein
MEEYIMNVGVKLKFTIILEFKNIDQYRKTEIKSENKKTGANVYKKYLKKLFVTMLIPAEIHSEIVLCL